MGRIQCNSGIIIYEPEYRNSNIFVWLVKSAVFRKPTSMPGWFAGKPTELEPELLAGGVIDKHRRKRDRAHYNGRRHRRRRINKNIQQSEAAAAVF